jgi:predicted Zn-dependent protease
MGLVYYRDVAINREKILGEAMKYAEKKKFDKAIAELRKITDADPNDVRALHKIGEFQVRLGVVTDAIDTFEAVAKLYAHGGFAPKAIAVYKQIREMLATQPPQVTARYGHIAGKLAELYRENGLGSQAISLFDEVATTLQKQGREPEAIEAMRALTQLDAQNPLVHLRLAEALVRQRDLAGAVEAYKSTATLLMQASRGDDAIQVLERCLSQQPDPEAARSCAELYLMRRRPPHDGLAALGKLQICVRANPRDRQILDMVARAFDIAGEPAKAAEVRKQMGQISS